MGNPKRNWLVVAIALLVALMAAGCAEQTLDEVGQPTQESNSGVKAVRVKVQTDADGTTVEQKNIANRLVTDNKPGAVKHLYVISAYSGQVLLYSTVKGKVTSSGKRLTPTTVSAGYVSHGDWTPTPFGIPVNIGGSEEYTSEVLQDDGTYGSSDPYVYWWDVNGIYRQLYLTGGQLVIVSSEPLKVPHVVIRMGKEG